MDFPKMSNPGFPGLDNAFSNVYNNKYDYRLWDKDVTIKLLTVPWDSNGSNVVKFDSDAERDKWFSKAEGDTVTLTSAMRVMPDNIINVPIPFDVACKYNYIAVTYPEAPVEFGGNERLKTFYWFITNVSYAAPSTTKLILVEDWWTNIINDIEVSSAMVERGHIAVANSASVDSYLANPRANTEYLLNPDFSYGELSTVATSSAKVFNAKNMVFCIVSYSNLNGDFGSQHSNGWTVPYTSTPMTNNTPAPFCFGCAANDSLKLLQAIDNNAPQFKRTIAGCFFISGDYLTVKDTFSFGGVSCYRYEAINKVENLLKLTKASFGYDSAYANVTKLYTYPYAAIEVVSDSGSKSLVRVEDTDGSISLATSASVIFPYISLDARLINIGGVSRSITFGNTNNNLTFNYGGRFYDYLFNLNVPVYTVSQSNAVAYDYSSYFDRQQQILSYNNAYSSATASNATAQTNVNNSASNAISNNAIGTAANATTTARSAQGASLLNGYADTKMSNDYHSDQAVSTANYEAEQAGLGVAAAVNSINANAAMASGFISGLGSALTGNVGGVISAATSIANAGVSNETSSMTTAISQSNNQACYTAATNQGVFKYEAASTYNQNATDTNNSVMIDNAATNNSANTSITANNAGLMNTNAANTRATADANAGRALNTAQNAVTNKVRQNNLGAPVVYGSTSNGNTATTRPIALFANVVTQRESDIASAGDMFLRYGYACNRYAKLDKLQVMKYFTYWKCSDVWLTCKRSVVEVATDIIKTYFINGVTVWSNPDSIGKVGVYENARS